MFRSLCDPSSGSAELCLTEITPSDSHILCRVLGRTCFGCDPSSGSAELCLTEITHSDSQIFCRVLGRICFGYYVIHHQGVQSCA